MKHTSLFCAVALAAAMGTSAFATVSTNGIASVNFEDNYAIEAANGWSVASGDLSSIIAAPLSESSAQEGYSANKHLELNTEGTELAWNPGYSTPIEEPQSLIEMKVRLVAADQAPAISDGTVHAAVCLVVDENNSANNGLYAYAQVGVGTNDWEKLNTSAFETTLTNGTMVALRVLMDYGEQTVTYEGALLANAEIDTPVYHLLGTTDMANPDVTVTSLSSISFKGTGGVDDLFVKEIEVEASEATVTFELWTDLTAEGPEEELATPQKIDTVAANSTVTASFGYNLAGETLSYEIYDVTEGTPGTKGTWLVPPTPDAGGDTDITMTNFGFQVNHTYLIKVIVGEIEEPSAYEGPKSGGVQILVDTDETAYEAAEQGNVYVPLSFTSFSVNGNSVTAGLAGTFLLDDENAPTATFVLVTQTTLGGTDDKATVTGTLSVTNEHTATLTFDLPQSDSLFVKGLYVADPAPSND